MSNLAQTIEVVLNGEPYETVAGQTLLDLVQSLDLEPARVAAELDGTIVKRDRWGETPVGAGARLELVQIVGGG